MSAATQLFEQHIQLAEWFVHTRLPKMAHNEDIRQAVLIGLWKAARTYDSQQRTNFSTYAVVCMRNEVYM